MPRNALSASFWNGVQDELVARAVPTYRFLIRELMADGYPPGGEPVDEEREYLRLVELKMAGDAMFQNSAAQARLAELERVYGPAPMPPAAAVMP